jgi:hypothetical protein
MITPWNGPVGPMASLVSSFVEALAYEQVSQAGVSKTL